MSTRSSGEANLHRKFLYALVGGAASAIGGALVDQLRLGEVRLSRSALIGTFAFLGIWIAWTMISKAAANRRRRTQGTGIYVGRSQMMESHYICDYPFAEVMWRVVEWVYGTDVMFRRGIRVDGLEIQTPPNCPVCGAELNQSQRFWGSWDWSCPAGDFSVCQPRDYELVAHDVLKLVRRDVDKIHRDKGKR